MVTTNIEHININVKDHQPVYMKKVLLESEQRAIKFAPKTKQNFSEQVSVIQNSMLEQKMKEQAELEAKRISAMPVPIAKTDLLINLEALKVVVTKNTNEKTITLSEDYTNSKAIKLSEAKKDQLALKEDLIGIEKVVVEPEKEVVINDVAPVTPVAIEEQVVVTRLNDSNLVSPIPFAKKEEIAIDEIKVDLGSIINLEVEKPLYLADIISVKEKEVEPRPIVEIPSEEKVETVAPNNMVLSEKELEVIKQLGIETREQSQEVSELNRSNRERRLALEKERAENERVRKEQEELEKHVLEAKAANERAEKIIRETQERLKKQRQEALVENEKLEQEIAAEKERKTVLSGKLKLTGESLELQNRKREILEEATQEISKIR